MTTLVIEHGGEWEVWIGLEGSDPVVDSCGFCIALGTTRAAAIAAAITALHGAAQALQDPDLVELRT